MRIPFGRRVLIGMTMALTTESDLPSARLKQIIDVLDADPLLPDRLIRLLSWASEYYHHPIGEVIESALPLPLRRGAPAGPRLPEVYRLTRQGLELNPTALDRAPLQRQVVTMLRAVAPGGEGAAAAHLRRISPAWRGAANALIRKGLVSKGQQSCRRPGPADGLFPIVLNPTQASAVSNILSSLGNFQTSLLQGITGSGKTEVYLAAIEAVVARGRQALVLVPEIGLTPQLVERFRQRLNVNITVMHSGLSDSERHRAWWAALTGSVQVVLGTRSAAFAPLRDPGLFIIDEEHDTSYKQQDGFRYHARDLILYRAKLENVPVVLGSATPAFESLVNVDRGRYRRIELPSRPGAADLPSAHLLDLRRLPTTDGLTGPLIEAIRKRIVRKEQSLIFLNRRGFAPVLYCTACSWIAQCPRCDAKLTTHKQSGSLQCHHCGHRAPAPTMCPVCQKLSLINLGEGTQRIEETLSALFPDAAVLRIDRDVTRRKGHLEARLNCIREGGADILVGTQLLTKGHDFPNVTLVGVVNADQGLYSMDFRAPEHLFQQIIQVAGRAGRADKPGEVLVQTWNPHHPYFELLRDHDYSWFAHLALAERRAAHFPPYHYLALLRAESTRARVAIEFLNLARRQAGVVLRKNKPDQVHVLDPVPAPMERRAGRYRAQLLVSAAHRTPLHRFLAAWLKRIDKLPQTKKVRWSIDVDPVDMY